MSTGLPLQLLISPQLKSFYLHKQSLFTHGTGTLNEQGYPIYYFDPQIHVNDVCPLRQVNDFAIIRYVLAAAIMLTQVLNPIVVPLIGLYMYYQLDFKDLKCLCFIGFFFIVFSLLGVTVFVWDIHTLVITMNVTSSIQDIRIFYIFAAIFVLGYNPVVLFITLCCTLKFLQKSKPHTRWRDTLKNNKLYVAATSIVELTGNLLSFHFFYIFLGLVAAPVATGFNLGLATTIFLSTNVCFVMGLEINKDICKSINCKSINCKSIKLNTQANEKDALVTPKSDTQANEKDALVTQKSDTQADKHKNCCSCICTSIYIVLIFVWMTIILYCVFFYMISVHVGPFTSTVSVLVFVVDLFIAMLAAIFPILIDKTTTFFKKTKQQNSAQ